VVYSNRFGGNPFLAPIPPPPTPKRTVFISSFHNDSAEVNAFIYRWATVEKVFTPKALATFDNDDFIYSDNPEYVMSEIRRKYIGDASVTIVLIGKCTHSRRYVDWEIKASLRRGQSLPNGLLAYVLPSVRPKTNPLTGLSTPWPNLPERLDANWNFLQQDKCYARYYTMPSSAAELRQNIEAVFADRTNRANLIKNDSETMKYNAKCKVCGVTH
jgi:antiphage defense system Thoeris ThsB-like protein